MRKEARMKKQERTKTASEEPGWYTSAAHPSLPGELTKTEPADLVQGESEEEADAKRRRRRWPIIIYVAVATMAVALGNVFDSMYWAAVALFFAIAAQPRERVPKLLRYFASAAVMVLAIIQTVMFILKSRGH